MKTTHYFITNLQMFSECKEAVEKLKRYLDDIEVVFPFIEEVFGQAWNDSKINIELDNSTGGSNYGRKGNTHIVRMGINNKNIQKEYPENLWGCLFHETHHAFMSPIIDNKIDQKKDFNGGHEGEPFNRSFMTMTYLRLRDKCKISEQVCKSFLNDLDEGATKRGAESLYREYFRMFSKNTDNFSKFISYLKSSDTVFTDRSNFRQDLKNVENFLAN